MLAFADVEAVTRRVMHTLQQTTTSARDMYAQSIHPVVMFWYIWLLFRLTLAAGNCISTHNLGAQPWTAYYDVLCESLCTQLLSTLLFLRAMLCGSRDIGLTLSPRPNPFDAHFLIADDNGWKRVRPRIWLRLDLTDRYIIVRCNAAALTFRRGSIPRSLVRPINLCIQSMVDNADGYVLHDDNSMRKIGVSRVDAPPTLFPATPTTTSGAASAAEDIPPHQEKSTDAGSALPLSDDDTDAPAGDAAVATPAARGPAVKRANSGKRKYDLRSRSPSLS